MKKETKVLIVLVILFASLGPLSYFFNPTTPGQIDVDDDQDQKMFLKLSGNVTGKVMEFEPYISYVGVSEQNNEAYVKSVIDSINYSENYTLKVMLNPEGNGYRYEIFMLLNSTEDVFYVGFRLAYRLQDFFSLSTYYPLKVGKVLLPEIFMVDEKVVYTQNQSVSSVLLYSRRQDIEATVLCPDFTIMRNGTLVSTSGLCVDFSKGDVDYGAGFYDVRNAELKNKSVELNVTKITSVKIIYNYPLEANISVPINSIQSELNVMVNIIMPTNTTPGKMTVTAKVDVSTEKINQIKLKAAEYDYLTLEDEYKLGRVYLPENVEIEGKKYEFYKQDQTMLRVDLDDTPGLYDCVLKIITLYDEITDVLAQKI